jgi:small basic protein (TIGR04137 family)
MSIHKSLVVHGKLKRHRNVLSRAERLMMLSKDGKWDEQKDSVFGIVKIKNIMRKAKAKVKKEATDAAVAVPDAAAAASGTGATPAAPAAKQAAATPQAKVPSKDKPGK